MSYNPKSDNKNNRIIFSDLNTYTYDGINDLMKRYVVAIPTLDVGDGYEIITWGTYAASATVKGVKLLVSSTLVSNHITGATASGTLGWSIKHTYHKTAAAAGIYSAMAMHQYNKAQPNVSYISSAIMQQSSMNFDVSIFPGGPIAGEVSVQGLVVNLLKQ